MSTIVLETCRGYNKCIKINNLFITLVKKKNVMFRKVPLSIIRSFSLYTQQRYMCWQLASRIRTEHSWSCSQAVSKSVRNIPLLRVQWRTPDDGQRNFPKHVEFYSKNKIEKLVHLVLFYYKNILDCFPISTPKAESNPFPKTSGKYNTGFVHNSL